MPTPPPPTRPLQRQGERKGASIQQKAGNKGVTDKTVTPFFIIMGCRVSALSRVKQAGAVVSARPCSSASVSSSSRLLSSFRLERTNNLGSVFKGSPCLKTPPPLTSSQTHKDRIIIAMLLLFVSLIFFDLLTLNKF